jgi:hypothetical protein
VRHSCYRRSFRVGVLLQRRVGPSKEMSVKREGRFTTADPAEEQAWLGHQSQMPGLAYILTDGTDIAKALKDQSQ